VELVGEVAARDVAAGRAGPPAAVGVYWFRDGAGRLLYVGSSRDLARRVRSYFAAGHPPASKPARVGRLAVRVAWRTSSTVLEALVLEAEIIRREQPHFNRRLKQTGANAYVRFDPRDPYPRLEVVREPVPGPWRYLGPFPGGRRLARALDVVADAFNLRTCPGELQPHPAARACLRLELGQCGGACRGLLPLGVYGRQLTRALAALGGGHGDVARAMGGRGLRAPRLAGALGGALAALRALRLARRVLVVLPDACSGGHRLLAVAGGRLAAALPAPDAGALPDAFVRTLAALRAPLPPLIPRDALDEVRIVTGWLAGAEGRAAAVDVERAGRAGAWAHVRTRTAAGPLFARARTPGRRVPA
jgi:DNA polymerase-3 subunit epsilon